MEDYVLREAASCDVEFLRSLQTSDLKGQVYDPLEEHIELSDPICMQIRCADETIGYALLDDKDERGMILLEWYLVSAHRNNAKHVLDQLIRTYRCCRWFVNSQDAFALPLMLENGFAYELDGLLFSVDPHNYPDGKQEDTFRIEMAAPEELPSVFRLVMQDGFYTGAGQDALAARIRHEEIYLLRSPEALIGVGFVSPLARTPRYADIAMIIDRPQRRQGFASRLVKQLVHICFTRGLIPTALTAATNIASRRTLEKCGFYLDGCTMLANLNK